MIEDRFDIPYTARMALREKQIQQNYRPIIAVHKWFARRPGTLFRGLLLAEFGDEPVAQAFTRSNKLDGLHVADPFMGGGTPLIEANRLGCDVTGFDINPMAYWIVRQELEHLDLDAYRTEAGKLMQMLHGELGDSHRTRCAHCGELAWVKYFLWVKQATCPDCSTTFDLWPGMTLAKDTRHPKHVLVCHKCGTLNEVDNPKAPGQCQACDTKLTDHGNAGRGRATCPHCACVVRYPNGEAPLSHRLFAIEYHCEACRPSHKGRFFKSPDADDLVVVQRCEERLRRMRCRFVPDERIPKGDETNRLHRWGYHNYRDMFNARQLIGLELSARFISKVKDDRVRNALATNLSDLLRYQNLCCRYDTMALKSLDVFSVHGFPVSLIQCESNLLGIANGGAVNVGSGGWSNIIAKYAKAKEYCDHPFETVGRGTRKQVIKTDREWIGDRRNGTVERRIDIHCADASECNLRENTVDAVVTDPPYFGNVQYAELMDFCYVWLRKVVGDGDRVFEKESTRNRAELTGNITEKRGLDHFAEGLSRVFCAMAKALKPERPLAFTYHHNKLSSYSAIGVAILDSGLACTATIQCPAEMGGSIHISGTGSSIVDSVFVCRKGVETPPADCTVEGLVRRLVFDVQALAEAGHKATAGDIRCMMNGHITRKAVGWLHEQWEPGRPVSERIGRFDEVVNNMVDVQEVIEALSNRLASDNQAPALFALSGKQ